MGRLTTHVLDTSTGRPAAGILIELFKTDDLQKAIAHATTNADGRCEKPLLQGASFSSGEYQLVFHAGDYFDNSSAATATADASPRFLNQVVIRFCISEPDQHYHVPLLLSPFGYSTYKGS